MSKFLDYKQAAFDLVEAGGGRITEELFVEKPGVLLLSDKVGITSEAMKLFKKLNLDIDQDRERLLAQFAAIITYLSAPSRPEDATEWAKNLHDKLEQMGHKSPYKVANKEINLLVSGLSVETMLELACHNRFKIGRICSSRTTAMDSPLFRVPGNEYLKNKIKSRIRADRKVFEEWVTDLDQDQAGLNNKDFRELRNMGHLGYKAGYEVIGASPQDWHQILIGRLDSEGVELELREVCERICEVLQSSYPEIIKSVDEYYATNPNVKE